MHLRLKDSEFFIAFGQLPFLDFQRGFHLRSFFGGKRQLIRKQGYRDRRHKYHAEQDYAQDSIHIILLLYALFFSGPRSGFHKG